MCVISFEHLLYSFMMFDNYVIPKESLLNKNGDVTIEGEYVTPFKDPNKKFGNLH